jgi:hypothetical protein
MLATIKPFSSLAHITHNPAALMLLEL